MEVDKKQFDKFLAAVKKKEVTASFDPDGWIVLNRRCNKGFWGLCTQECAKFKSKLLLNYNLKRISIIRLDCYASGQPVDLCEISREKENENG